MKPPERERRERADRRARERRSGKDRRVNRTPVDIDRRSGDDRRSGERRSGIDRRLALASGATQMQAALGILVQLAQSRSLNDEDRRLLDTAVLRLRFAADRLEDAEPV
ncbi:MAG: hypothetical protein ACREMN_02415 [Gemmatimonadales bacterium]